MPQHSRRDVEASPADDEGGATDPEAEAAPAVVPDLPGGPLLTKGGGPAYGNFVHGVLERVDFVTLDTPDGRPKLDAVASRLAVEHGASDEARDELVAHLGLILATPLDGGETDLAAGFSLRALAAADRRDEVAFDLRLGAGEDWRPGLSNGAAQLDLVCLALEREGGRTIPPTFVARLRSRFAGRSLAGILNGKIDLVFRAACTDGRRRYFIADYKTNLVGDGRAGHYTREWLASTMAGHGYYLQALLYTVALHRHLAVRLTGYDYDRDVGGWQYLFLRGMHGPDTARMPGDDRSTCLGVYADRFPRRLVEAVDAALSGQEDEREAA
jgi:exodeoxyribonuclease V beta subunit